MQTSLLGVLIFLGSATALFSQAERAADAHSQFDVKFNAGAIESLRQTRDSNHTEFVTAGRRVGDVIVKYRRGTEDWRSVDTSALGETGTFSSSPDGAEHLSEYRITNGVAQDLSVKVQFMRQADRLLWSFTLQNETAQPLEIGDLALPLVISRMSGPGGKVLLKHSFISGDGSFLFWLRSDSAAPFLVMLPQQGTHLEYWEGSRQGGYRIFIHSAVAGAVAKEHGTRCRQPNTSLTLAPKGQNGDTHSYGFRFLWANDYDSVRQLLVDEGEIDVNVVPGMTVPNDLFAEFVLRTKRKIKSVEAEFPDSTRIESVGGKVDTRLFKVSFARLGENRLTVHY